MNGDGPPSRGVLPKHPPLGSSRGLSKRITSKYRALSTNQRRTRAVGALDERK